MGLNKLVVVVVVVPPVGFAVIVDVLPKGFVVGAVVGADTGAGLVFAPVFDMNRFDVWVVDF